MSEERFDYQAYFDDIFRILATMEEIFEKCGAFYQTRTEREPALLEEEPDMPEADFPALDEGGQYQIGTNGAIGLIMVTSFQDPRK